MRPSSNSRAPTAAANLGREHQTALGSGGRHPGSTAENVAAGRGNPGGNSQGVWIRCPQPPLAAAAAHRPAQALAASPLAMAGPTRRKAPREHRGKCGRRTRQPRGQLTGCLWDVPLASSCRCSSTQPRSSACCLAARHAAPIQWKAPGSTAENAAAGRGNPGAHSLGVCGMCPQPPLALAVAPHPNQLIAGCSP